MERDKTIIGKRIEMEKMVKKEKQCEKRGVMGKEMKIFGLVIIFLGLMVILMNIVSAVTNVSNCQTLSSAGETYTLNTSISNNTITADCINITAQNIALDCAGYSISSTQNFTGVYSNQFNTTVKNCNVSIDSKLEKFIKLKLYIYTTTITK